MPKVQRERCQNFLEEEKEKLLDLVDEFKHILENKKTDAVWANQKRDTWEKIATRFNGSAKTGTRNGMQLKLLYEGMKKKARQNVATDKVQLYKTGGGSFTPSLSQLDERIVSANKEQFLHKTNIYDSNKGGPSNRSTLDLLNIDEGDTPNRDVIDTSYRDVCDTSYRDTHHVEVHNEIYDVTDDVFGEAELVRDSIHNLTYNETGYTGTNKKIPIISEKQMRQQKHEAELAVLKASKEKYIAETDKIKSENAIQLQLLQVLKEKAEIEKELAEFNLKIKKTVI